MFRYHVNPTFIMKSNTLVISAFGALALALTSGCTHISTHINPINVSPTSLSSGQVLPHSVALILGRELADFKLEYHGRGDTFIRPLGPALQDCARNIANKSFQKVDVVSTIEEANALISDDVILIPRGVKTDISFPTVSLDRYKTHLTLVVEWKVIDRAGQSIVWLKTINANSDEPVGNAFTWKEHDRLLYQKAFNDLTLKTINALQEAHELGGRQ
jgi:hypothetical protein